jgi:uncharacterized lipoprotein YmbA
MRYRPFLLFMVLLPLVAGCFRSPSARFYSLIAEPHVDERPRLLSDGVRLEVSSIIFPRYLDDPRMVVRTGANEIRRDEYERWIESPRTNFRDALLKGLSEDLQSANVFSEDTYPQRRGTQVLHVEVLQFDVTEEGIALLQVRWAIGANRDVIATGPLTVSEFSGNAEGSSGEEHVAALSKLLREFSQVVAQAVVLKR